VGNEQFTIFIDDNRNFKKGEVRFNFTQIFIDYNRNFKKGEVRFNFTQIFIELVGPL
jgi:hypothetical protein